MLDVEDDDGLVPFVDAVEHPVLAPSRPPQSFQGSRSGATSRGPSYFHRKWTKTRPKFFESFSTRW